MNPTKTLSAAAALGVTVALAGAPAALANGADQVPRITPPDLPFPGDKIEHRVTEICTVATGSYRLLNNEDGCHLVDWYITSDRDHEVWRDKTSGALKGENATVNSTIFSWTAKSNTINVGKARRPNRPSNITREAEGAMNREAVARGWYTVAGEEVRNGQRGVVLKETAASPRDNATTELFVDPTTYATIVRSTHAVIGSESRVGPGTSTWTDTLVSVEQLPRNAETEKLLAFGDHSDAAVKEVIGEDETIANAARKLGLKAKTRAKIAKKAKAGKKASRSGRR